jgi:hypothetical protein
MGSLLDQIKGGMSKPKRASKAGGSKSKIKKSPKPFAVSRYKSGKTAKARPRTQSRVRTSKVLRRG